MIALAKSTGTTLQEHSNKVYDFSNHLLSQLNVQELQFNYKDIIRYSTLLHDIGKATKGFQTFLTKTPPDENEIDNKDKFFTHQEISWAFTMAYLDVDETIKKYTTNAIYWHHGIPIWRKPGTNTVHEILNSLHKHDIEFMKCESRKLIQDGILDEPNEDVMGQYTPKYLYKDTQLYQNDRLMIVRSILVASDRFVSQNEHNDTTKLIEIFEQEQNKQQQYRLDETNFPYGEDKMERFNTQIQITKDCDHTTIVKAPAGFGKTLIGVMWSQMNNKKTIWVCPRNTVAKAVYEGILREAKAFNTHINIELFLSGEVQHSNNDSKGFESDIIVTNIDNFLKPNINNSVLEQTFFINNANVIFDEYHELVQKTPLFSFFIEMMKIRHRFSNGKTLLLSATPINIAGKWNTINNKTKVLPNENEHYQAAHDNEYTLSVIDELVETKEKDSLIIFNSVRNAQTNSKGNQTLYHSYYEDDIKKVKYDQLIQQYGKNSKEINRENLIGTLVVQASLDVSFHDLYESVLSPESTLQRIGRCDRWGNMVDPTITVFYRKDKSEGIIRKELYNEDITNMWFNTLKQYSGKKLTLNKLYNVYNEFSKTNEKEIKGFIDEFYRESNSSMENIFPIKMFVTKEKPTQLKAGGNKFRSTGNEIFYICKNTNGGYSNPFNTNLIKEYGGISKQFKEEGEKTLRFIKKEIKTLVDDDRFLYHEMVNPKQKFEKLGTSDLERYAKYSGTPYIRFDVVYDEHYGVIDRDLYELLRNSQFANPKI